MVVAGINYLTNPGTQSMGSIRFYIPWSTVYRKSCYSYYVSPGNYHTSGATATAPEGKLENSSLLALQGFKLFLNAAANNMTAGAIGKWYGLK